MTSATPQQQRQLLALQEVDSAIRRLEHKRAHLPEQQALDDNARTMQQVASDYADAQEQLEEQRAVQRTREQDISNLEARRKAEEARLYSGEIRSEKQAEAIRGELTSVRHKKSDYEDELLDAMERIEQLETQVATLTSRHRELKDKSEELAASRDEAAGDIDAELDQRRRERDDVASELDESLLKLYESVRAEHGGTAVAPLQGRSCQGCFLELSAIELEEVKSEAKTDIPRCPQCDRLLVVH